MAPTAEAAVKRVGAAVPAARAVVPRAAVSVAAGTEKAAEVAEAVCVAAAAAMEGLPEERGLMEVIREPVVAIR